MDDTLTQAWEIFTHILANLLHPEAWQEVLRRPGVFYAAFLVVTLIVFTETGLLVGFFLPGDSLLVTVGIVAYGADWPIWYMIPAFWTAAVVGDSTGYLIGKTAGPKLFQREKSFFFRKNHLLAAHAYYEEHGGKTIIVAKFIPFLRTFAPVVAGIGAMGYKRFFPYTFIGSGLWINSMVLLGYLLPMLLEPVLQQVFGPTFRLEKHIDKIILVVVMVSVLPIVYKSFKAWRAKPTAAAPPAPVA